MKLINRKKSKKARAVGAAKKTAKAWGVKKVVEKVVPKRALLAVGGGLATLGALFAARKRKAKAPEPPAWTPPPPPRAGGSESTEVPATEPPPGSTS
jgi:hypothetical protein